MTMTKSKIGYRIARIRAAKGLSTQQLADKIGKSQATISRIENGKQGISIELLSQIAKVLRTHPFAFLSDDPLSHSILLPPNMTIRSDSPMRILARVLLDARARSKLSLEQAASHLNMGKDELEAIEMGYALPESNALRKLAELYPVDERQLFELAQIEKDYPAISEKLSIMESLLHNSLSYLEGDEEQVQQNPHLKELRDDIEKCLGKEEEESISAERKAGYFSIGHMSDRLLKALQDPEFHEKAENLAIEYTNSKAYQARSENNTSADITDNADTTDTVPAPLHNNEHKII